MPEINEEWENPSDADLKRMLEDVKTIAVVGISRNPEKPSHHVAKYLQEKGYRVIPVNPAIDTVLGEKAYSDLSAVPETIDMVDLFRPSEAVPPFVDAAILAKAKVVWMQEGIVNAAAAAKAEQNGLTVVMDRCLMVEHARLLG
ncbi:MAG: CoA-binding protein [bacterium]|jgi:predicted CoA-binding protein